MKKNGPSYDCASRRDLLKAFAAAGAGVMLPTAGLVAQNAKKSGASGNPHRIDVHHQYSFVRDGNYATAKSAQGARDSIAEMDKHGIDTAILSTAGYGDEIYDGSEMGRTLARKSNEYAAKLVDTYPKRFGFMAVLPIPDIDGSMREIEFAFDKLHADGVGILSNVGDKWPGDPAYFPVFQELNRRKAVMFIHPFVPKCCRKLVAGVQDYVVEFDFDTTRAVTSLLYNGVLSRCPDIKLIVNHSGAAVPVLSGRIKDRVPGDESRDHRDAPREGKNDKIPNGVMYELKRLYYECAHATYPVSLAALLKFAPSSNILFGTDYPAEPMESTLRELDRAGLSPELLRAMQRGNAERLFPRFKS
jgi:predicted TIM-barrel fold metal-dependent hydrolase